MNIFVFEPSPIDSAEYFFKVDPKRARKQIVELCQILAQVTELQIPKVDGAPYKQNESISNHPATIWVRQHKAHYSYCIDYLHSLLEVFHKIVGKQHGCFKASRVLSQDFRNQGYWKIKLGWHTKKASILELIGSDATCNEDVMRANKVYLDCKLAGLYKN